MRDGLARALKRVLPHMERIAGALLTAAGLYLVYYWWRVRFGEAATLADDPIVESVTRFSAEVQARADERGLWVVAAAALVVALALVAGITVSGAASLTGVRALLGLALALLVLGAGCGGTDESGSTGPPPDSSALTDLAGVDDYARAFDRDAKDRPRLVLLLAPT